MSSEDEVQLSVNVNGQSKVPPGFRFHPTEEELLRYYLTKKVSYQKIDLDVIRDVDLNKLEPWDIQEKCKIGSTPQNDWYLFSHKDKKYPSGTRTNRATAAGFWKATGRDKVIYSSFTRIGMRKTLVFYKGRAPHGQKSEWIMHEYRLDDNTTIFNHDSNTASETCDATHENGWVVCRVFKKKSYQKAVENPQTPLSSSIDSKRKSKPLSEDDVLNQLLAYMGSTRSCKQEHEPVFPQDGSTTIDHGSNHNWADLDRLVASQLNGSCYGEPIEDLCFSIEPPHLSGSTNAAATLNRAANFTSENDLWSFARTSSSSSSFDPLHHLSV